MSAQETKQVPLKPCPCGKTPESLHLYGETHQAKWAMVMGSCCNEWLVEFKNHYATDPDVIMLNAIEAWNLAERAAAPSPVEPEAELARLAKLILDESKPIYSNSRNSSSVKSGRSLSGELLYYKTPTHLMNALSNLVRVKEQGE